MDIISLLRSFPLSRARRSLRPRSWGVERARSLLEGDRAEEEERLDRGEGSLEDVRENLLEMQRINDWLGGTRALTRHLYPRLQRAAGPVVVLDLGTGGACLPLRLAQWGRRRGIDVRVAAVDWAARNLEVAGDVVAGEPRVQRVRADALRPPFAREGVDWVVSSLFLHHLSPAEVCRVLAESYALARRGLIMSDLVRGWLPYLAFHAVAPVLARHPLTRADGALSVRRAYTPAELRALAAEAGLVGAKVFPHFPWRMTLVCEK